MYCLKAEIDILKNFLGKSLNNAKMIVPELNNA
jgi:hypothetical protein